MTAQPSSDGLALLQDEEGRYYGVPRAVVERNAVSAERRSQFEPSISQDRSAGREPPGNTLESTVIFAIPREELAACRLSEEQAATLIAQAQADEVRGHYFTTIPNTSKPWHHSMVGVGAIIGSDGSEAIRTWGLWINGGSNTSVSYAPPSVYHKGGQL
jgi:hypothetical protein